MERSADECSEFHDAVYIQSRSENSLVHLTVLEAAMTVVDCTAPLNRYTCYGAIEVVAIIIIIIINTYCWAWENAELFVEHSLKKVMDRISVSCQVRDSVSFCRTMLCIVWPMPSCGVCVCPIRSRIVSKRINISSKFCFTIA